MKLVPLKRNEWDEFIKKNQSAFALPFIEKFGETAEEIIPAEDIISSLEHKTIMSVIMIKWLAVL